jgi:hypothetical protein
MPKCRKTAFKKTKTLAACLRRPFRRQPFTLLPLSLPECSPSDSTSYHHQWSTTTSPHLSHRIIHFILLSFSGAAVVGSIGAPIFPRAAPLLIEFNRFCFTKPEQKTGCKNSKSNHDATYTTRPFEFSHFGCHGVTSQKTSCQLT